VKNLIYQKRKILWEKVIITVVIKKLKKPKKVKTKDTATANSNITKAPLNVGSKKV